MTDRRQPDSSDRKHAVGEDTPKWLAVGFGVIGTVIAVGAVWLWMQQAAPSRVDKVEAEAADSARGPLPPGQSAAAVAMARPEGSTGEVTKEVALPAGKTDAGSGQVPGTSATAPTHTSLPDCPAVVTVRFDLGSAAVHPEFQPRLGGLADWLNDNAAAKVSVHGFADSSGWDQHNMLLSYRRAQVVAALLAKAGVQPQRIVIRAAGSLDPIAGIPTDAPENRRVTLEVKDFDGCQQTSR